MILIYCDEGGVFWDGIWERGFFGGRLSTTSCEKDGKS